MERVFQLESLPGIFAALAVITALRFTAQLFVFLWGLKEKRDSATEKALAELAIRMAAIEAALAETGKIKYEVRRLHGVIRIISGDKWPSIKTAATERGGPYE